MKILLRIILAVFILAMIIGAYWRGRNDVLIGEYKKCQADMIDLTYWNTNQPPELKELLKAHYYYLSNRIPKTGLTQKTMGQSAQTLVVWELLRGRLQLKLNTRTILKAMV